MQAEGEQVEVGLIVGVLRRGGGHDRLQGHDAGPLRDGGALVGADLQVPRQQCEGNGGVGVGGVLGDGLELGDVVGSPPPASQAPLHGLADERELRRHEVGGDLEDLVGAAQQPLTLEGVAAQLTTDSILKDGFFGTRVPDD